MTCTNQCKRNYGWDTAQPFSYENMLSRIVEEDLPGMQALVAKAVESARPYLAQYRVRFPDGSVRWIEAQGKVFYQEGVPVRISGTSLDISRSKELEILKDELLNIAMHELKTPITAVKGTFQLIERHLNSNKEQKLGDMVSRALNSVNRISMLLQDMMEPILSGEERIILRKSTFDMLELVKEVRSNAEMLNPASRISVSCSERNVAINADRYKITQVLTNLLNNAIKFSQEGTPIFIEVSGADQNVRVTVSDKGIGIPKEDRMKIFEKFYRAAHSEKVDGLGIGLFLCSEIVLRHNGRIAVEDQREQGTRIGFTLPR